MFSLLAFKKENALSYGHPLLTRKSANRWIYFFRLQLNSWLNKSVKSGNPIFAGKFSFVSSFLVKKLDNY